MRYALHVVLPRHLRLSLYATQAVAFLTLLRSVALDRWITVLASVILFFAATAAHRGRSWGVGVAFGQAVAFAAAWAFGIAPPWFAVVGLVGALPAVFASRALARLDKTATVLLATLAASVGALGALAWKEIAWSVFTTFPSLWPSRYPHHGFALLMLLAGGAAALGAALKREKAHEAAEDGVRVRVAEGERIRVGLEDAEDDAAEVEENVALRARRSRS